MGDVDRQSGQSVLVLDLETHCPQPGFVVQCLDLEGMGVVLVGLESEEGLLAGCIER